MKSAHLHWLLELMVVDPLPLEWILPTFNRQHTNALPLPNYTLEDYSQLLTSALRKGVIAFLSNDQPLELEDAISSITTVAARGPEKPAAELLICLTDAGGATWENLAKPKWSRFFKFERTYNSSNLDDLGYPACWRHRTATQ